MAIENYNDKKCNTNVPFKRASTEEVALHTSRGSTSGTSIKFFLSCKGSSVRIISVA
jgi:hypothetical protein